MQATISKKKFAHVVIAGGGFTGLVTAKLLSAYFDRVTLIERFADFTSLPSTTENLSVRRGIPQGHHLHVLLARGQQLLEHFFPNILETIQHAGCRQIDWALDTEWSGPFGRLPIYASDIKTLTCSRQLLDVLVRKDILAQPTISIKIGCVENFVWSTDKRQIEGVYVRQGQQVIEKISAELVVDVRGRSTNLPKALGILSDVKKYRECVPANIGYASRFYQLSATEHATFCQFYRQVKHHSHILQGAVISPIENHQLVVTLTGIGQYRPSNCPRAFAEHLAAVVPHALQHVLQHAQPITPIYLFRNLDNVHSHYGKLPYWPSGLIALGDAVCQFNPIYGQGMTVALEEILLLENMLFHWKNSKIKKTPSVFSSTFTQCYQKKVDRLLIFPWLLASISDAGAIEKPPITKLLLQRYLDFILYRATRNKKVHRKFLQVLHMLKTPFHLFL